MARCTRLMLTICMLAPLAGCRGPALHGRSPLKSPQMKPDSVALDIIFVRYPAGQPRYEVELWQEIDEQALPPLVRQRLGENGFRAGLVAGQVPLPLAELMQLAEQPPAEGQVQEVDLAEAAAKPRTLYRHLQLEPGRRGEVLSSDVYERLPLLICCEGELTGRSLKQAQAVFALKAFPQPSGLVRLQVLPEVHHDQPRQNWVARDGMFLLEAARPKEVFDSLQLSVDLAPGDILVLGAAPNRPGSLGHYFFTDEKNAGERKLLLIRLTQIQQDVLTSQLAGQATGLDTSE